MFVRCALDSLGAMSELPPGTPRGSAGSKLFDDITYTGSSVAPASQPAASSSTTYDHTMLGDTMAADTTESYTHLPRPPTSVGDNSSSLTATLQRQTVEIDWIESMLKSRGVTYDHSWDNVCVRWVRWVSLGEAGERG